MRNLVMLMAVLLYHAVSAQQKIIDMHIHAYTAAAIDGKKPAVDFYGNKGAATAAALRQETFALFKKWNIEKAVVSGSPEAVAEWAAHNSSGRILKGIMMFSATDYGMDTVRFERMVKENQIQVFGEVAPYYSGTIISDSIWQPYLRICERYDVPVAVHTGGGDPGGTYSWSPQARLRLGDPYFIEDVLVKYPKLRVYMMHAGGEDWPEHGLRLMAYYPQLYADIAVLLWVEPNTQRYVTGFLKNAKQAGYLDRIMFGSDQMMWPGAIEKSIKFLNGLPFLTKQEKENIFYNNAARFLRLNK